MGKLNEQESILSQAGKLFVVGVLTLDDYRSLKKECKMNSKCLIRELQGIYTMLKHIDQQRIGYKSFENIFQRFSSLDTAGKNHLVNLIPPLKINFQTGSMTSGLNSALSKYYQQKSK